MDPDRLFVWLDAVPEGEAPSRSGMVCRRHADAMMVPRGWTLDDHRDVVPRLFRVADRDATSELRRIRRPARKQNPPALDSSQLPLDATGAHASNESEPDLELRDLELPDLTSMAEAVIVADFISSVAPDSDETRAIPWRPTFDDDDDLDGVLKAESPLLARAFRGLGRNS